MERKRKMFSIELSESEENEVSILIDYYRVRRGSDYKKTGLIKRLIADKYAEVVKEADDHNKTLEDFLRNV